MGIVAERTDREPGAHLRWLTSTTGPAPMLRSPKRPAVTNRNSRSVLACALPLGWCAPSESRALNLSKWAPGGLPLSATARWTRGTFALRSWPESKRPLEPGQVRLGLRSSGVNFRDVLIALGDPADYDVGLEGSGVVLEVADDVLGFAPGDRVMGQFFGAGPVVVADHRKIVRIPSGWSYAQAATVTAVFLTAYHALAHIARVSCGRAGAGARRHGRSRHGCGAAG